MRVICLPMILTLTLLLSCCQAAVLPIPICAGCIALFQQLGCLNTETIPCRFLAVKFTRTLGTRQEQICDNFICNGGYGQAPDGHQCKTLTTCLFTKWRGKGICPLGGVCCAP